MIGIDIIKTDRFDKIEKKDFNYWMNFFTIEEWEYAFSGPNSAQRLAGIFATKEAVIKADKKNKIKNLSDIGVTHEDDGSPHVSLAVDLHKDISVSISHEKEIAVAVAIIL